MSHNLHKPDKPHLHDDPDPFSPVPGPRRYSKSYHFGVVLSTSNFPFHVALFGVC